MAPHSIAHFLNSILLLLVDTHDPEKILDPFIDLDIQLQVHYSIFILYCTRFSCPLQKDNTEMVTNIRSVSAIYKAVRVRRDQFLPAELKRSDRPLKSAPIGMFTAF